MPEQLAVSPLLDGFTVGTPVSNHVGVRCYPAVQGDTKRKYIVKVISIPASKTQLDALLITGAYKDSSEAVDYYKSLAEETMQEAQLLQKLSESGGFLPYEGCQLEPMRGDGVGYEIYLLGSLRLSLDRYMHRHAVTHLEAVNLGIDLCGALAACRKEGMIYADLKPSNIFISGKKGYKIGDMGFLPMESLKYITLPEKFRSRYTAPELLDDLSVLNETADTYSVGLILYQIFNNGVLPEDLSKELPSPAAADEEMAGILKKACDPDPAARWESPEQMRQAFVDYMQRNTINDVPIMSPLGTAAKAAAANSPEKQEDTAPQESTDTVPPEESQQNQAAEETPSDTPALEQNQEEQPERDEQPENEQEQPLPEQQENEVPVLPADEEVQQDESDPADAVPDESTLQQDETGSIEQVTSDLSEWDTVASAADTAALSYDDTENDVARQFAALSGEPEKKEDSLPEQESEDDDFDLEAELESLNLLLKDSEKPSSPERKIAPNVEPVVVKHPKKKKSAVGTLFTIFLLCLLLAGGVWGYMYYTGEYLKSAEVTDIQETQGILTVSVDSDAQEDLLSVICSDTYGNTYAQTVQNGKAEFTSLAPGTFYKIQIQISGFHKLKETVSYQHTMEGTTNVITLTATAGTQDGSVVLNLISEGAEPDNWQMYYSADGEPELTKTFSGNTVTLENLSIGKLYTFRLEILDGINHTPASGQNTVQFTPVQIVDVQDLAVSSFSDGTLTLQWNTSASAQPEYWVVHCTGDGYDETQQVTQMEAVFTGISESKAYNVDVCAKGMTQTTRLSISANPITLTDFTVDASDAQELKLSWQFSGTAPEKGWQVEYTLDNSNIPSAVKADGTSAVIAPRIPGAVYHFSIQTSDDISVFNGAQVYTCPEADGYTGHGTWDSLSAKLLVTPDDADWEASTISSDQYTQSFTLGQSISVVLQNSYSVYLDDEEMDILYVFRDADGNVVPELISEETRTWRDMFEAGAVGSAELNVPVSPVSAGSYVLYIYLNGALAASTELTVS